jgi:hypothetical protein
MSAMKNTAPLLLALALSATATTEAEAGFERSVVQLKVGPLSRPSGFGTGVVVNRTPPIVATCAHVIDNQSPIYVYVPEIDKNIKVEKVVAHFERDIAFLLLDTSQIDELSPVPASAWDRGYPFPADKDQIAAVTLTAFGEFSTRLTMGGQMIGGRMDLRDLGLPGRKLPVLAGFQVLRIIDGQGGDTIIHGGDSGGPVFAGDKIVGLAAGFVDLFPGHARRRPFAVPLLDPIPAPSDFAAKPPVSGKDPYGSQSVHKVIVRAILDPSSLPDIFFAEPEVNSCMNTLQMRAGRLVGRRDGVVPVPERADAECQSVFTELMPWVGAEERNERKEGWTIAEAEELEATARRKALVARERAIDEAVLRQSDDKSRKGATGRALAADKPKADADVTAYRERAEQLTEAAREYEKLAQAARKHQEEILRKRLLPK